MTSLSVCVCVCGLVQHLGAVVGTVGTGSSGGRSIGGLLFLLLPENLLCTDLHGTWLGGSRWLEEMLEVLELLEGLLGLLLLLVLHPATPNQPTNE